jgi:hypothetical protein
MTPDQTFGQLLGLGKSWKVVESRFESESSTFFLKVEETPELWPEESALAGTPVTCHDHVEPMQWRQQQGVSCDPAVGGTQQALHQKFEAFALTLIRKMPVKRTGT